MGIFKLYPIDLTDPSWEASSHRGPVVVRARDEAAARKVAEKSFAVKIGFPPGRGIRVPPWTRPQLVRIEQLKDSVWPEDGPDQVLDPAFG